MCNKIKIFAFMLATAFLIAGLFPISLLAADNDLVITSAEVSAHRGDTVEVVLNVTQNPGFAALLITVSDSEDLKVTDVKNGSVMAQMTSGKNILWDSTNNSTATGTLVTLTFKIADDAKLGKNEIKVKVIECFQITEDDKFDEVNVTASDIVINVEERPVDETTSEESKSDETATAYPSESTEADNGNESESKAEQTTSVKSESADNSDNGGASAKAGCFGTVGATPLLIVALVGIAFVFKKKH